MPKRNIIIISLLGIIAAAGLSVLALVIFVKQQTDDNNQQRVLRPGDTLSNEETPNYKTCSLVSVDEIKSSFGSQIKNLADSDAAGVVASNGELAQTCSYSFSTDKSTDNKLLLAVYTYKVSTRDTNSGEPALDASWARVSDFPKSAYFKHETSVNTTTSVLRVTTGPSIYLFSIGQPVGQETFDYSSALISLSKLAKKAKYTEVTTSSDDAPPAPKYN